MKPLSRSPKAAQERRKQFVELRRSGMGMVDAAAAVGVLDPTAVNRYERWFQALERGEMPVPGESRAPPRDRGCRVTALRDALWLLLHARALWRHRRTPVPGLPCDGRLSDADAATWRGIRDLYEDGPEAREPRRTK